MLKWFKFIVLSLKINDNMGSKIFIYYNEKFVFSLNEDFIKLISVLF